MNKEQVKVLREIQKLCKEHLESHKGSCKGCQFEDPETRDCCRIASAPMDWELAKTCKHCGELCE